MICGSFSRLYFFMRAIIVIIFFVQLTAFSQGRTDTLLNDNVFSHNHFSVNFIPNLTHKAKIKRTAGRAELYSRPNFGFEGGINYTHNFNKKYGFETGIHMGVVPFDVRFHMSKDEFVLPWDTDFEHQWAEYEIVYYSFPLLFEYRKDVKPGLLFSAKLGSNLRYYPDGSAGVSIEYELDSISPTVEIFSLFADVNPDKKIALNYHLSVGIIKTLGYGLIRMNLVCNLSFNNRRMFGGSYWFRTPDDYTEGNYQINASYIGLEIGYVFTRTKD